MSEFYAESWTNSIGQKLLPGDKVLTIASGYGGDIKVRTATFLGIRKGDEGLFEGVSVQYLSGANKWEKHMIGTKSILPLGRVYRITE